MAFCGSELESSFFVCDSGFRFYNALRPDSDSRFEIRATGTNLDPDSRFVLISEGFADSDSRFDSNISDIRIFRIANPTIRQSLTVRNNFELHQRGGEHSRRSRSTIQTTPMHFLYRHESAAQVLHDGFLFSFS